MTLMVLQFKTLRAIPAILIMCAAVGLAGCGAAESANAITERTIVRLTPPPQSGREATPISREVRIVRAQVPEGAGMGVQEQEEEEAEREELGGGQEEEEQGEEEEQEPSVHDRSR